jgi:hypothetical protein
VRTLARSGSLRIAQSAALLVVCLGVGACAVGGSARETDGGGTTEIARCVVHDVRGGTITCAPPAEARAGDRCVCSDPQAGSLYVGRVQTTQ